MVIPSEPKWPSETAGTQLAAVFHASNTKVSFAVGYLEFLSTRPWLFVPNTRKLDNRTVRSNSESSPESKPSSMIALAYHQLEAILLES